MSRIIISRKESFSYREKGGIAYFCNCVILEKFVVLSQDMKRTLTVFASLHHLIEKQAFNMNFLS